MWKYKKVYVLVRTKEEIKRVADIMSKYSMTYGLGDEPDRYLPNLCLNLGNKHHMTYASRDFAYSSGFNIISFDDFLKEEGYILEEIPTHKDYCPIYW